MVSNLSLLLLPAVLFVLLFLPSGRSCLDRKMPDFAITNIRPASIRRSRSIILVRFIRIRDENILLASQNIFTRFGKVFVLYF